MTDYFRSDRLVLPAAKSLDSISRLLDEVKASRYAEQEFPEPYGIRRELVWQFFPGLLMLYAEDTLTGRWVVSLLGEQPEVTGKYLGMLTSYFTPESLDDLLAGAESAQSAADRVQAVLLVGLAAPYDYDERVFALITRNLDDDDPAVRRAAVLATGHSRWPQWAGPLRGRMDSEPDAGIAAVAAAFVSDLTADPDSDGVT
jgi:hypothetical protein